MDDVQTGVQMGAQIGVVKPRLSAGLVLTLTGGLTAGLMALRLGWVEPANPQITPKGWAVLPFALALALGLAVVAGLIWANRQRWRAVLRPNRGRVIGALALGFVTPVAVFSWLPWILGGMWLMLGLPALQEGQPSGLFFGLLVVGAAAICWYPIACLIVSGIHRRALRVAVFALMFWAGYGAIVLVSGNLIFAL